MTASAPPTLDGTTLCAADREDRRARADGTAALDDYLRDYGVAVASQEAETALDSLDDLTPSQRRVVARMAGRIAAGALAPARRDVRDADDSATAATVRTLFGPAEDVRE